MQKPEVTGSARQVSRRHRTLLTPQWFLQDFHHISYTAARHSPHVLRAAPLQKGSQNAEHQPRAQEEPSFTSNSSPHTLALKKGTPCPKPMTEAIRLTWKLTVSSLLLNYSLSFAGKCLPLLTFRMHSFAQFWVHNEDTTLELRPHKISYKSHLHESQQLRHYFAVLFIHINTFCKICPFWSWRHLVLPP